MYLSKIDIHGFKSFAEKTALVLNEGITAIVGPNGCGKTNIVDALRWALGEQRYSTLRSDKMEDVIFNGTKIRKPIGLAQVSLTIQNNKGVLPIEYDELMITRRVFRSGESDYQINRTSCRLKDIVTLFMDTGMGSNAYSVIELRMVETILSDKVDERRRMFEEAAGVTRYKSRRKEAFRRLNDVEADLLRVDDIIAEVTKSVNSLNRQAKKAERFNRYQERLRVLEIDVLQRDFTNLVQRLHPLEERMTEEINERDSTEKKLAHEESLLNVYRAEEREVEEQLEGVRNEQTIIVSRIHEAEQSLMVKQERERSLNESRQRLQSAGDSLVLRMEDTGKGKSERTVELERYAVELAALEDAHTTQRENHLRLESVTAQKKLEAQSRQSRLMELVQDISRRENEIEKLDERHAAISSELVRMNSEDDEARKNRDELKNRTAAEGKGQEELSETVIAAEREFREMENRKQMLKSEIDLVQNRAFELQSQIGEKMTKIDFLNGLVDRLEGYSESVQHLLRNREWSPQQIGTVADAVNTEDEFRIAIEAALGDAAHYLIVHDMAEAVSGLQNLKEYRKGKATFVCLSRIPAVQAIPFPVRGDGILGWALENTTCESRFEPLLSFLLRNVLLVRDEVVAHACISEYSDLKCVTLNGDIFTSGGLIRGGSHGQEEGGLIGKKDQIDRLNLEVVQLKNKLEENQDILGEKNREYSSIDLKDYAENMRQSQKDLSEHERLLAGLMFEIEKNERLLQKNGLERETLDREQGEIRERKNTLQPTTEELYTRKRDLEKDVEQRDAERAELELTYNSSNEELNAAQVAVVEKRAEIQNLRNEFERLSRSYVEYEESLSHNELEKGRTREELEMVQAQIRKQSHDLDILRKDRDDVATQVAAVEAQLNEKREEVGRVETTLQDARKKQSETVALVHETELKISQIKQRIESIREKASEEYNLSLEVVSVDEDDVFDLAQAKEEIQDLHTKIKSIGLVNPLAFEEWKQEKERLELMTTQRQDLVDSRKILNETISEINVTAKEKFIGTFEKIRENFISIFKSLFDEGDEADLILAAHEDPLEAKIDIIAKPRGKRPHSIEMLSGGEKTLTAIALLFAIYLVKPSPFCILDEVDAPLDDANIDRYIRILRRFSSTTQFIVVTHNKRTMAAADTLYGVTMEEEGISKLVAVNFSKDAVAAFARN